MKMKNTVKKNNVKKNVRKQRKNVGKIKRLRVIMHLINLNNLQK